MGDAEGNLDQLNKCCGLCLINPFSSVKKTEYKANSNDKEPTGKSSIDKNLAIKSQPNNGKKINEKDSIDEDLDQIGDAVNLLKGMFLNITPTRSGLDIVYAVEMAVGRP